MSLSHEVCKLHIESKVTYENPSSVSRKPQVIGSDDVFMATPIHHFARVQRVNGLCPRSATRERCGLR